MLEVTEKILAIRKVLDQKYPECFIGVAYTLKVDDVEAGTVKGDYFAGVYSKNDEYMGSCHHASGDIDEMISLIEASKEKLVIG